MILFTPLNFVIINFVLLYCYIKTHLVHIATLDKHKSPLIDKKDSYCYKLQ